MGEPTCLDTSNDSECIPELVVDASGDTSTDVQKTKSKSSFASLYKNAGRPSAQEQRRNELIQEVRARRNNSLDIKRKLLEIFEPDDVEMDDTPPEMGPPELEAMEVDGLTKRHRWLKIMLSEWLTEVPADLEENWLVKLCPQGGRRLVIAHKHKTVAFNKYGVKKNIFRSMLPGSHYKSNGSRFTVLDCLYSFETHTYYVLDIIAWNSYSLVQCSAEFRFFFLKSKIEENPELHEESPLNYCKFRNLPYVMAELPIIEGLLRKPFELDDTPMVLDGVLFYHKEMYYKRGVTPFVGWLKPYMVPEMLKIPVHEEICAGRPPNYVSLQNYLDKTVKLVKEKKNQRVSQTVDVDTCDSKSWLKKHFLTTSKCT